MTETRSITDRSSRIFTLVFLACVAILGFALYLQHVEQLYPCPWCIVQRLLFMAVGLIALVAALHRPGAMMVTFYAILGAATALAGAVAAGYHVYLQSDDARANACVGSTVERFLDRSDVGSWIPALLQYDGPCTLKPWAFLWLSIPEWALISFIVLCVVLAFTPSLARR
ncbi:MAG: disulfide bond formation protein B [Gammaproteobacteria bacterium]|nr:disulfide bond formation protein B [Gammaproteobacteria bacterium]